MNSQDMSIITLVLHASWVVQLVMLLLLGVSVASWAAIFRKLFSLKRVKALNEDFEREFWSGTSLNDLYAAAAQVHEPLGLRVLIVEDNPVARSFLCRVVRESFSDTIAITEAGDLESARAQISLAGGASGLHGVDPFKLILVDLELPDGNGMEFLTEMAGSAAIKIVTGENAVLLEQLRVGDLDLVVGRLAAPEQMTGFSFEHLEKTGDGNPYVKGSQGPKVNGVGGKTRPSQSLSFAGEFAGRPGGIENATRYYHKVQVREKMEERRQSRPTREEREKLKGKNGGVCTVS